jgi:hypothetical protein
MDCSIVGTASVANVKTCSMTATGLIQRMFWILNGKKAKKRIGHNRVVKDNRAQSNEKHSNGI